MQISMAAYKKDGTGMASIIKTLSCGPCILHPDNLFLKLNTNGLMKLLYQKNGSKMSVFKFWNTKLYHILTLDEVKMGLSEVIILLSFEDFELNL